MSYKKTTLPNGIRVVTERMDGVRSISLGICITSGSRDEGENEKGISHLIEHMLFKGTETRTAKDIAVAIVVPQPQKGSFMWASLPDTYSSINFSTNCGINLAG